MSPELYITGLVGAITALATTIGVLYKSVLGGKDQLVAIKDQQLAYRESIIAEKNAEIAALQQALKDKDAKVDRMVDVLETATDAIEARTTTQQAAQRRKAGQAQ